MVYVHSIQDTNRFINILYERYRILIKSCSWYYSMLQNALQADWDSVTLGWPRIGYGLCVLDNLSSIAYFRYIKILTFFFPYKLSKARFRGRISHVPNAMQMSKTYCLSSFALNSAHVRCDVWTRPNSGRQLFRRTDTVEQITLLETQGNYVLLFTTVTFASSHRQNRCGITKRSRVDRLNNFDDAMTQTVANKRTCHEKLS
jgi:hypothetical protein